MTAGEDNGVAEINELQHELAVARIELMAARTTIEELTGMLRAITAQAGDALMTAESAGQDMGAMTIEFGPV